LGISIAQVEDLKREMSELKSLSGCKSAIVNLGRQALQVCFEESQAIVSITRRIKDA
jgi:hypothetical protein